MRIQDEVGITFIVVTHDQEEAMTLATRIGVMNAGKIVQTGSPREIYEAPANRFVADFVGSVNLFEGRVARRQRQSLSLDVADVPGGVKVRHERSLDDRLAMRRCAAAGKTADHRAHDPAAEAANNVHGVVPRSAISARPASSASAPMPGAWFR